MNKPSGSQITLPRMILYISAAVAVLLVIFTGFIFQRRSAASSLDESRQQLETNFATRQSLEEDQLEELQDSLEAVEREIQQLEDSFPSPGAPFAVFSRGKTLAALHGVEIRQILRQETIRESTPKGDVELTRFVIDLQGEPQSCINFIASLEGESLKTVRIEETVIDARENSCALILQTAGQPENTR